MSRKEIGHELHPNSKHNKETAIIPAQSKYIQIFICKLLGVILIE